MNYCILELVSVKYEFTRTGVGGAAESICDECNV